MGSKNGVKVDGEIVQFEPHILFQKLAVAAEWTHGRHIDEVE